jgi:hypothetical protein
MRNLLLLLALPTALAACSQRKKAAAAEAGNPAEAATSSSAPALAQLGGPGRADSLFLYLERTPCFGMCKAYRIEVFRSGFATYDGRMNMEKEGRHTARIDKDVLQDALQKAEALGFFGLQDKYDGEVTDLPSTFLRIVANGKDKKVMGRVGQPQAFRQLVTELEALLLPVPWKPVVPEP